MIPKSKILAVDDEEGITEYLKALFETEGFEVKTASGGWQAWEGITKEQFDFVLTDVRMERGDGIELVEKIRDMPEPKPLVAIMSAHTDVLISDVYDRGAVAFISKPNKSSHIIQTVHKALLTNEKKWMDSSEVENSNKIEVDFGSIAEALSLGLICIGRGGMFLHLTNDFPLEEHPVEFKINLKNNERLCLEGHGIVRWMRQKKSRLFYSGIGIEFVGLKPESKEYIVSYVKINAPDAFIPIGMIPPDSKKY